MSIPVEVGRKRAAGADKSEMSTAPDGKLKEGVVAILMGSLDYLDSSKSMEASAMAVQPVGAGCNCSRSQMDSKIPGLAA